MPEREYRIPSTVRHEDFRKAIKPLLDLIGVSDREIYTDLHVTGTPSGAPGLNRISLVVAVRKEGDEAERPQGVQLADPPQEFAELAHFVVVEVV